MAAREPELPLCLLVPAVSRISISIYYKLTHIVERDAR
jgi:hypothetical protein